MTFRFVPTVGALAALALTLAGCEKKPADNASGGAPSGGSVAAPAGQDWTTTVSQTADGGFVMGNPDAPVKLVEYLSLTCSHCATFAKEAFVPLRDGYVKKGTVSFEIRNYVRDPIDVTAALVTRCNGAAPYFQMTEQVLGAQGALIEKAQKIPQAEYQKLGALPPGQQFQSIARAVGVDQFARQRGVGEAKLDACLGDKAALDQLIAMQKTANDDIKIQGTPTFLINGEIAENAGTWALLEPMLKAAGG